MRHPLLRTAVLAGSILAFWPSGGSFADGGEAYPSKAVLGEALFHDPNLSRNRSQSCSTCHAPGAGFADVRQTEPVGNDVSLGDDGRSLGGRNAPTAGYAAQTPPFSKGSDGAYRGGFFWDGRARTLEDQAGGPPLNPVEMGMPDKAAVVSRLREEPAYDRAFRVLYGEGVFRDDETAYSAMVNALAEYERGPEFSSFDSRYDRYLRGEEKLTDQEELGRVLFFSQQFTNCSICHEVRGPKGLEDAVFTNHKYFNIGVPANPRLAAGAVGPDTGLAQNPAVAGNPTARGKFKIPGLRNVAVTGPYMHNGVFKDLRTVVLFYVKYNSIKKSRQIDPETGREWGAPEVPDNLAMEQLTAGPALDDKRVDAIVAFLKTLTDRRYEGFLTQDKASR
ncbi:cytochrome-c peroxidase [Rhizobium puerariae]|uniref:Cytochrome-c peroxidase n=1 Tax=Rhizobium puerariae TaxID=1585791 RepID=A0ABV6ABD3_9HYPH